MQPLQLEWKKHILDCMEKCGTFKHTLNLLIELEEQIEAEISKLEEESGVPNPLLRLLLNKLSLKALTGPNVQAGVSR